MDILVGVLPEVGSMSFVDFVAAVRVAGGNGSLWLRAKHAGLIVVELIDGNLRVSRGGV